MSKLDTPTPLPSPVLNMLSSLSPFLFFFFEPPDLKFCQLAAFEVATTSDFMFLNFDFKAFTFLRFLSFVSSVSVGRRRRFAGISNSVSTFILLLGF